MDKKETNNRFSGSSGRQILDSKSRIPETVRSLVKRKELLQWIKNSEEASRILVFQAGAGFGKTVAMSQLAKEYENSSVWYQIDAYDNDPMYFLQGLHYGFARFWETEEWMQLEEGLEKSVLSLAEKITESTSDSLYLMLDDFHIVTEERVFQVLKMLLNYTPERFHICMTVKGGFPQWLSSYLLTGQMMQVEAAQLYFSGEETSQLLYRLTGREPSEQLVLQIMDYTSGWPAGVMFAGLMLKNDARWSDASSALVNPKVFAYIDYEIFRKLPYDIQQFLLDTSPLKSLNPGLCDHITGKSGARSILEYLTGEGLFIYKFRGKKTWYRYHSIFQDFLESRLDGERRREILEKAARYLLRRREMEEAVYYAIQGDVYDVVETAMEQEGLKLLAEGKTAIVGQWVQFLEPVKERLSPRCMDCINQYFRQTGGAAEETEESRRKLKVSCLGRFLVEAEGKPLSWRTKKAKELFAFLFDKEGKTVEKRVLIFHLWPDASEKNGSTLFNTTVSYLRKSLQAVGASQALVVRDKQYCLNMAVLESDYQKIEEWAALAYEDRLAEITDLQEFTSLYQGDYFGNEDYLWLIGRREAVEQMFLKTARKLARYRVKNGDYEGAADILNKVLEIDEGSVYTLREMLTYRVAAGDMSGAKRQYDKLRRQETKEWEQELEEDFLEFINQEKKGLR